MGILKVDFPLGNVSWQTLSNGKIKGKYKLEYNSNFNQTFNKNLNKTQAFLDSTVAHNLMKYVSFKTGMQEASIPLSSQPGSGKVHINVPYAKYQAYSKKIKKRVGKRGTQPWERMCADKKDSILRQTIAYARRLNG